MARNRKRDGRYQADWNEWRREEGGGELDICANTHTHKMARWGSREGRVKDSLRAGCSCEVQSPSVHTHNLLHVPRAGPRR